MTAALLLISAGDQAWWAGDRRAAAESWRAALEAAGTTAPDRAAEAMARMRLLHVQGNYAPVWHGPLLERALAACPAEEPWCGIAAADRHLWLPAFTGADPSQVAGLLEKSPLEGPASARRAWAAADPSLLHGELDGMGEGIRTHGARAVDPGTWVLGIGLSAAPGAGVGAAGRFTHPDLFYGRHLLQLQGGGDSRGGWLASGSLLAWTGGARPLVAVGGGRQVQNYYSAAGDLTIFPLASGWGMLGAQVSGQAGGGRGQLLIAGQYRAEAIQDRRWQSGGLWLRGAWVAGAGRAEATAEAGLIREGEGGAGPYGGGTLAWIGGPEAAGGRLLLRPAAEVMAGAPFFRSPSGGGARLLRGLPVGRWRAEGPIPALASAQIEYRHGLIGPLRGQVFADTAWIDGPHATIGAGVALELPPLPYNTTRLEFGYGVGPQEAGVWGLVLAWGEAF